ncbi:MAG: pilus assembly protein [Nitrospiraceae bacterium]
MTRPPYAFVAVALALTIVLSGALLGPIPSYAQNMIDYTYQPVSMPSGGAVPDVLFVMDASSSMRFRVATSSWSDSVVQNGIWDTMKCYVWDPVDARFEVTATVKTVATPAVKGTCGATEWDGNFLNWAVYRRIDVAHVMWTGGTCWHPDRLTGGPNRNADLTCRKFGTPLKATITLNDTFQKITEGRISPAIPGASTAGRMPDAVRKGGLASPPANIYIQTQGSGIQGAFCVDNDNLPGFGGVACNAKDQPMTGIDAAPDSGPEEYTEQGPFYTRLAVDYEPTGVLQNTGSKARFGLMEFADTQKGYLTVPIGSRQTRKLGTKTVVTWPSNYEAMIRASDNFFHLGGTPTMEALYQALRYLMQLPPAFTSVGGDFVYGYSPAGALGASTTGAMGAGELSVLSGSETCPAEYLSPTCGRDPYVYGSAAPAWASPTAQMPCCKATVILMTDDDPDGSSGMPAALNSWFITQNGSLLPGYSADYHNLVSTAYWMHINDIRGSTFGITGETAHPLTGNQFANVYAFYLFGKASAGQLALKDMAKWGAFEDSNGNNKPDLVSEWDKEINATGLPGADGIPDAYFESESAAELSAKLTATLATVISKAGSGTFASVLSSSVNGEGAAYQAFYYPSVPGTSPEVKWAGYMHSLFVDSFGNLREDTNRDGKLVYQEDSIVITRYDGTAGEVKVDRYADANGDGKADSGTCSPCDQTLKDLIPIWEAGNRLALKSSSSRKILTWVDSNNNGLVDATEQMEFKAASPDNSATLMPYLRAATAAESANIINFVRGDQVAGYRNRQMTVKDDAGVSSTQVWKLGDIVNSTPTLVGAPRERYDVLYGDAGYTAFFTAYKNRRQVAYVGANDGMLHAVNVGYYHRGDDPGTSGKIEHGWFTRTPSDNSSGPLLGDELWGFVPYHLLPQLQWLAQANYTHVSYVDLKPKATDARIFCDGGGGAPPSCITGQSTSHPSGWGTILIGGMRLGGSCEVCPGGNGPPLSVTISGTPRKFYSAYFVLDVTNPELDPKLLWVFTDTTMGLSTSYPAIARGNPSGDAKTSATNAKWFMVVGSGPTNYGGDSTQISKLFTVDLASGPGAANGLVTHHPTKDTNAFMGDLIAYDANLDFRVDSLYMGDVFKSGTIWAGTMYRLTTGGGSTTPATTWGKIIGSDRVPTVVLQKFTCTPKPCPGTTEVGPILVAPAVTLDDARNTWLFFGSGRLFAKADESNTEMQSFFGVKDPVVNGGCNEGFAANELGCQMNDLIKVTNATVCVVCAGAQVTGVGGSVTTLEGTGTSSLQGLVASKDGWWTELLTVAERNLTSPTLIGGTVFFTTYVPTVADACLGGAGTSSLYALFYLTGSAYKESLIGTYDGGGGNTNVKRSISLGTGAMSQMALHMGSQGTGTSGSTSTASGCTSRMTGYTQSATGAINQVCVQTALGYWSRWLSWMDQKY